MSEEMNVEMTDQKLEPVAGCSKTEKRLVGEIAEVKTDIDLTLKCQDLERALDIQNSLFHLQKLVYEKAVTKLTNLLMTMTTTDAEKEEKESAYLKVMEDVAQFKRYSEDLIKASALLDEKQKKRMEDLKLKRENEEKCEDLKHEAKLANIGETSKAKVVKLIEDNDELIRDLVGGCEELFAQLKAEYLEKVGENTGILDQISGKMIIEEFKAYNPPEKGIILASITVVCVSTAGWASWEFIVWIWPCIAKFAERIIKNKVFESDSAFVDYAKVLLSEQYKKFLKFWEEGKPLDHCTKVFANTDFLFSALHVAPDLHNDYKTYVWNKFF